jgi:hypothetical protein
MSKTIDPDTAADFHEVQEGGFGGEWKFVTVQPIRTSRWHEINWLVVQHEDGDFYGLEFRDGLTEDQENEHPWDDADGPLPLTRLYPREVTTVEYRTTEG